MNKIAARFRAFAEVQRWIWAAAGSFLLWLGMGLVSSRLNLESLVSNSMSAAFLAIAAIGQMYVISCGRGAIDLSIPGVITITAFLSTGIINAQDANILQGVAVSLAAGALVGLANGLIILFLEIPPIIATLATGYVLTSASLIYNEGFRTFNSAPLLVTLTRGRFLGVPFMFLVTGLLALAAYWLMKRTVYGRSLTAVGQNVEAAALSGIRVRRVQLAAYVISGLFSGAMGVLLAARVSGAFLGMGDSYLMETIGAVVIGGTLIFGGRSTVLGTLFGCLFFVIIVTAMQVAGFDAGVQKIVKGVLIILVLVVATEKPVRN
ncbi:MAG TPA: ABC transporter permease [Spirochaetia bacterium]|nr:ABC transporter permease [Spirochaetales bacterium]HRY79516.1 ABC transporter permease [Spirochaetia bacterium]HRZ89955.1 ABC transporter permease [Spirochaetia bacterium]